MTSRLKMLLLTGLSLGALLQGADVAGAKDPAGMKRYEGSEIIGYRAPKFDEYLIPLGPPTDVTAPAYDKSIRVEGLVSFYTYLAPTGRTSTELFRNYRQEFQRLGLTTLYEKRQNEKGWFGPGFTQVEKDNDIGQILEYSESTEQVLVAKSKDPTPTYYYAFVIGFNDGYLPERLRDEVTKDRAVAQLVVITPEKMDQKMILLNAADMSKSLADTGKVALYGIYFENAKDSLSADSQPTLQEVAKLLKANPSLRLQVVGHTDNQGTPDYNLDLSRRRALNVVHALTSSFAVAPARLSSFGCGPYAPVATNDTDDGKAKNRRVELVKW